MTTGPMDREAVDGAGQEAVNAPQPLCGVKLTDRLSCWS